MLDEDVAVCDCPDDIWRVSLACMDNEGRFLCVACKKWDKDRGRLSAEQLQKREEEYMLEKKKREKEQLLKEQLERETVDPNIQEKWKQLFFRIDVWLYQASNPTVVHKHLTMALSSLKSMYHDIKHNPIYEAQYFETLKAIEDKLNECK